MTNEVLQCIETRRSVRRYRPEQIREDELEAILRAGTYAASGMGRQPVKFAVLQKPEDVAELESMNAEILGTPGAKPFYGAPTVVIVLADANVPTAVEDGSLALGDLMLAAHSVGVGSCWIHRAREEFASEQGKALLKKWGVTGDRLGVGHCILGYADGPEGDPAPRRPGRIVRV